MIGRVVVAVLDLALLALITLAAYLLRAPRIDAAMADIPTDDWADHPTIRAGSNDDPCAEPECDCREYNAAEVAALNFLYALPAKEPAE